ncbi:MAG: hypothetical protein IJL10_02835 [Synergistaceae bacterium]|nr:hypothetical protein [Synergistaceae bacterium]
MNAIKERIFGAVTVMDNSSVLKLWEFITNEFAHLADWDSIPEKVPDEIDLQMLAEIEQDKDCHEFIPADEAEKMLGLS